VISVLIPVKDGGSGLARCLEAVSRQRLDQEVEIVVVDSGSSDGSPERARSLGALVHEIPADEFDHGGTRNLAAELSTGDVLVFTTQDAYAGGESWLATLVAPLATPGVAGVYGRQLPHEGTRPPERYFLDFLYGSESRVQRLDSARGLSFETTLFSNVNAAIPRAVWEEYPFAEKIVMSEDQEWSRRVLLDGWTIVYEPRAAVRHSHAYTLGAAFRRFFDSGASAERAYVPDESRSLATLRRGAARYALGEIAWLWRTGQGRWLPYAAVYELSKFAGLQLGRRHRRLPLALRRRLSANPRYWEPGS
jgi:glycosyltransferase involved in cell wall biosynthesis